VGSVCIEFFGIQPDGKVQIPWSAWQSKDVFRSFAETLAAAIPGAICYETPKTWTVSKDQKKRLDVVEILSATAAIRAALEEMNARLHAFRQAAEQRVALSKFTRLQFDSWDMPKN
jgi:2-methylisocitrate lyase-like PEP mutase family enzyme